MQWTKFYLQPQARGDSESPGALLSEAPRKTTSVEYPTSGMTKAGVASASWTSTALAGSVPRDARLVSDRATRARYRSHRSCDAGVVGLEHERGYGYLRDASQHRSRGERCVRARPARPTHTGRQRMASRIASRARRKLVVTVSALSRASHAKLAQSTRARAHGGGDVAHLDGIQA